MTKRERVYASIQRSALDALPWQFDFTNAMVQKVKNYYGTEDVLTVTGDHFVTTGCARPAGITSACLENGLYRNEFGSVWRANARDINVGDWGDLVEYPITEPSLEGYTFPEVTTERWEHVPALRAQYPQHFLMVHGSGLFQNAWGLCGFENYLAYTMSDEFFVQEMTERLADFSCALTAQLLGKGADAIRYADDLGFQTRLMFRPDLWRRIFKPQYQRIYEAAHQAGMIVMIHSCGNITEIIPDLIEIGVEVIHAFQPEAMDVAYCQQEFGKDVTFWGGLGSQSTIPCGTVADVRREVRDRLDLFRNGGYILAPAGAVPTEAPVENIVAIIEMAMEQRLAAE